jgi:hypothetical protein
MYFNARPPVVSPKIEIMSSRDGSTSDIMPEPTARILFCTGLVGLCVPYRRSMSTTKERKIKIKIKTRLRVLFSNEQRRAQRNRSDFYKQSSSNRIQWTIETALSIHVLSRTREQRVKKTHRKIEQHLPIATFLLDTRSMSIGRAFRVFPLDETAGIRSASKATLPSWYRTWQNPLFSSSRFRLRFYLPVPRLEEEESTDDRLRAVFLTVKDALSWFKAFVYDFVAESFR